MITLKRRLTDLWQRQGARPDSPQSWPDQLDEHKMVVTIREPMKLTGMVLVPGKYAFRMLDPGVEPNLVQIFNEDQTRLLGTLSTVSHS